MEPPRLYLLGFPHNNCGGACVRQGKDEWKRLLIHFPERYAAREQWEAEQRAKGGARANRAFCSVQRKGVKYPLTLAEIRAQVEYGELPDDQHSGDICRQLCLFS